MTHPEFNLGWRLLLLQPWAYRYKAMNEFGELSSEAKEQAAFYFDQVKAADGAAWQRVCREYAKGKEWPSVDALRKSLSLMGKKSGLRIADPAGGPYLSRDEFGAPLYEAIRLQAAQRQADSNALLFQRRGLQRLSHEASHNAETLRGELTALFNRETFAPEDVRRVLEIGGEYAS